MRDIRPLLLLMWLLFTTIPLSAATFLAGDCAGATHQEFSTAFDELGTTSGGPHTLRLCPGSHATPAVVASWGHDGLTIESLSGTASDTELVATDDHLLTAASQDFTVRDLRVVGSLQATGFSNITTENADVTGTITTAGNLSISSSSIGNGLTSTNGALTLIDSLVSGPILVQNNSNFSGSSVVGSVTVTNGNLNLIDGSIEGEVSSNGLNAAGVAFTGDISATAGTITINGGTIAGFIEGGSQDVTLSGVTMGSGGVQVAGGVINIDSSQLGSENSPVQIHANNGITATNTQVWGNLSAAAWADIHLVDAATVVYGTCSPEETGEGICTEALTCSAAIGAATINEVRKQSTGTSDRFVELRILDPNITSAQYSDWTLRLCSSLISPCLEIPLSDDAWDDTNYPWLLLSAANIPQDYLTFGQRGQSNGMEIRLDDGQGRAIDYLSVDDYSDELSSDCDFAYDTTMEATNAFTIMRLPDGTGTWATDGPGNSGVPTPGGSNDGEPAFPGPDHIRIVHSGANGVTCLTEPVTIQACADSACTLFGEPVQVSLSATEDGTFESNAFNFTGQTTVQLRKPTPSTTAIWASSPDAQNESQCFIGGVAASPSQCVVSFNNVGIVLDGNYPGSTSNDPVSSQIAAKPSDIGFNARDVRLRTVRDDGTGACEAAVADQTLDVLFSYGVPIADQGLTDNVFTIEGINLDGAGNQDVVPLEFDDSGTAPFSFSSRDSGRYNLSASMEIPITDAEGEPDASQAVVPVSTTSNDFVVRPLAVFANATGGSLLDSNPVPDGPEDPAFARAGENFALEFYALSWTPDRDVNGDGRWDGCTAPPDGVTTDLASGPLWNLGQPSEADAPVAPAGGVPGTLSYENDGDVEFAAASAETLATVTFSEVGIMRLDPEGLAPFLGEPVQVCSPNIGRFIPARFTLQNPELIDRAELAEQTQCSSEFTYVGERLDAEFDLWAESASGGLTMNYTGDFARLSAAQLELDATPTPEFSDTTIVWDDGIGSVTTSLEIPRDQPMGPQDPFELTTAPQDDDAVTLTGDDLIGDTRILFGRVVIDGAVGSELGPLELPWRAEYWDGATWRVNADDSCTELDPATDLRLFDEGGQDLAGTDAVPVGGGDSTLDTGAPLRLEDGRGTLLFSAPGSPGWLEVLLLLGEDGDFSGLGGRYPFLRDDLNADSVFTENPRARASFGLFSGDRQRVFLRELVP